MIITPEPIYTSDTVNRAYKLRYNWMGWPSSPPFPPEPNPKFFTDLAEAWERDGIRLLEYGWSDHTLKFLTSVTPEVSPVLFTARMKGRLQHALRKSGTSLKFSRKLAMSTVGENQRTCVESYVQRQVEKEGFADPRFEKFLRDFTVTDELVDLSKPVESGSGRYQYNLHLVLVVQDRFCFEDESTLQILRDGCFRIARKKGHRISNLSMMPDHLHLAVGGHVEQSPEEIALSYMNNLAFLLGQDALWMPSYYVGSFGEYDMGAIRQAVQGRSCG